MLVGCRLQGFVLLFIINVDWKKFKLYYRRLCIVCVNDGVEKNFFFCFKLNMVRFNNFFLEEENNMFL